MSLEIIVEINIVVYVELVIEDLVLIDNFGFRDFDVVKIRDI